LEQFGSFQGIDALVKIFNLRLVAGAFTPFYFFLEMVLLEGIFDNYFRVGEVVSKNERIETDCCCHLRTINVV